ncbi:uncharacterized protein LOC129906431 isoform X1 [Episyrphus balteatus]|uniref:uncharacterized protein LOC129906431 isoform X1 n=1 Tax=Episyrphus balteatus TaxID=286459 RepID=UPI0024861F2F|nr:uncharacterized protein LOC129906431 isoform X1 [Episyrphus balteatus]
MKFALVLLLVLSSQLAFTISASKIAASKNEILTLHYEGMNIDFHLNITVFYPQGLRVSIPHRDGLELFSFHGIVTSRPLFTNSQSDSDDNTFAHDVTSSINGQWVYENQEIKLEKSDVLNYWVFLQYKGTGQRFSDLSYVVKKTVPMNIGQQYSHQSPAHESASHQSASHQRPSYQSNSFQSPPHQSPPLAHSYTPPNQIVPSAKQCECNDNLLNDIWSQLNVTVAKMRTLDESVKPLEEKLNSLTEIVVELVKNMDIGTNLKLVGNLPVQTNPVEDVRHLIVEKLKLFDLRSTILQAEYTSSGISFEVSSSIDKLRILKRSNDILSKLSYQIIDPNQRPAIDFRMA